MVDAGDEVSGSSMSRHFNPAPGWPAPPGSGWRPSPKWRPDPAWPAPPQGWAFWVDDTGQPVTPPPNSYPPPSHRRRNVLAGCGCLTIIAFLLFGSCGVILAAGQDAPTEVTVTPTTTITPTKTVTPTVSVTATVTAATPTTTAAAKTKTVTPTVTVEPPPPAPEPPKPTVPPEPAPGPTSDEGAAFYQNCDAVRAAGAAPILRGEPGYSSKLDRDGDGIGCEN